MKKFSTNLLLLISFVAWPLTAIHAEAITTSDMRSECLGLVRFVEEKERGSLVTKQAEKCLVFISSATNAYSYIKFLMDNFAKAEMGAEAAYVLKLANDSSNFCTNGKSVSSLQRVKIWLKWTEAHPKKFHLPPAATYLDAMQDKYPC